MALLALTDVALNQWKPDPPRLPGRFSGAYLSTVTDSLAYQPGPIVFLGDSVLWGYQLPASQAVPTIFAHRLTGYKVTNLSFEGGSPTNSEMLMRWLLAKGIRPRLVIFNVNMKQFNPANSAYRRLHPALEEQARPLFNANDLRLLALQRHADLESALESMVQDRWALYRYRADIKEALFGAEDMATLLRERIAKITGLEERQAAAEQPTAERFLGTYDMSPLSPSNVAFSRLLSLSSELQRNKIPAIAFMTPTNHRLLHEYIDIPEYDDNVAIAVHALRSHGITVLNLDRSIPANFFIDSDHLTAVGSYRLTTLLWGSIKAALR